MKSYNHLWEKLISDENILLAIRNASKGNMKREMLTYLKYHAEESIPMIRNWIEEYEPHQHRVKIINDGISAKKREIIVPTVQEHIVQHAVMNILKPIFMHGMYEHSYASVPGRGCHRGMKVIKKWIRHDTRNVKYCLKLDIQKYFDSISQDILIQKLKNIIHDEKFLNLLIKIIHTTNHGLPLGFYTSQWFANFYLQKFEHYVKENLKVVHYIRYMDDMVLFGSNKRKLRKVFEDIVNYLSVELGLQVKHNWQLFRFHTKQNRGRFLDFMGFRFYRNRITLRRKIALKAMRKARRIGRKPHKTVYDARQMLTYIGWTKHTDTYAWFQKYIIPFVDFRSLRKIVSNYDKE